MIAVKHDMWAGTTLIHAGVSQTEAVLHSSSARLTSAAYVRPWRWRTSQSASHDTWLHTVTLAELSSGVTPHAQCSALTFALWQEWNKPFKHHRLLQPNEHCACELHINSCKWRHEFCKWVIQRRISAQVFLHRTQKTSGGFEVCGQLANKCKEQWMDETLGAAALSFTIFELHAAATLFVWPIFFCRGHKNVIVPPSLWMHVIYGNAEW